MRSALTDEAQDMLRLYSLRIKAPHPSRAERGYRIFFTSQRPWRLMAEHLYNSRDLEVWLRGYAARIELMDS